MLSSIITISGTPRKVKFHSREYLKSKKDVSYYGNSSSLDLVQWGNVKKKIIEK